MTALDIELCGVFLVLFTPNCYNSKSVDLNSGFNIANIKLSLLCWLHNKDMVYCILITVKPRDKKYYIQANWCNSE